MFLLSFSSCYYIIVYSARRLTIQSFSTENPFRFSSEYQDSELGLICYNYRYYNTEDGRWISREPLGESLGANLYSYVGNQAGISTDYLGLLGIDGRDYVAGKSLGWSNTLSSKEKQKISDSLFDHTPLGTSLDDIQTALDIAGTLDPTPICDGASALLSVCRGDFFGAGCNVVGMIPYYGDVFKWSGKMGRKAAKLTPNQIGKYGEDQLEKLVGGKSKTLITKDNEKRVVDRLVGRDAHEAKTGRKVADKFTKKQADKDFKLKQEGKIDSSTWHFYRSPETQKIGPSPKLNKYLEKKDIDVIIHD